MAIIPDNQPSQQSPDVKAQCKADPKPERPPMYSPARPITSSNDDSPFPRVPTFKTKPTNFLVLSNDRDSIRGEFVINPSLQIPPSMLPRPFKDETIDDCENLSLRSRDGSVHADIWLLGVPIKPRRTTIALTSLHGSIHTQLRTVDTTSFSLCATAPHGSVKLDLPRSFTGLLVLCTRHGNVHLSKALLQHATQLSPVGNTRRYFIGNFALLGDQCEGDHIEVETVHGSIRLRYVDEDKGQVKKGPFSWLLARL